MPQLSVNPWRSIRTGLSAVFLLFLVLVAILGAFSVSELRDVNRVSAEIRDRWLQSTRALGDLNNYTSDARAAEASRLLAHSDPQKAEMDREIVEIDRQVARAERSYLQVAHDAEERALYARFIGNWNAYHAVSGQVLSAAREGRQAEADALYASGSLKAYAAASDALGVLTDRTVVRAREASKQATVAYRTARALIAAAIVLAALGLAGGVYYTTRAISRPLLDLTARMRSLAANETRIDIPYTRRRDEVGEMARAVVVFRANAIELARSQQALIQQASLLEERLEAERRLTGMQRNFVSMASHEFRTPLTIIDGHAQRLASLKGRLSPDDVAERAGRIRKAVLRLRHAIEQLLESTRLSDGDAKLYYHPVAFDPAALLREVCQVHRDIAPEVRIVERYGELPADFVGDPKLLYQVISNLVSNAVKYSPDAAVIDLDAQVRDHVLEIIVQDHGIGIPPADLPQVFDRYHRGGNVGGVVGAGVGLYLVKMVVDLHAGQVAVASRLGEGTRVTVSLPLTAALAQIFRASASQV
ncbi:sensor histidine kinase [Phenylobacterium montanum]|uniref:histidine kinase n=1 Tax=Phenylobacterium montanum TaxID=2823693 RepID=A0A975FW98_9CAUL|nr:ATP-binding protein [Caulobacter sp. S6]QUD85973.1 MCP four helix bundle domain-containing protein [Caulobacter sp. S6]